MLNFTWPHAIIYTNNDPGTPPTHTIRNRFRIFLKGGFTTKEWVADWCRFFFVVVVAEYQLYQKAAGQLRPITASVNGAMNQSEFAAIPSVTCSKRGKNRARKSRLVLVFLLIG